MSCSRSHLKAFYTMHSYLKHGIRSASRSMLGAQNHYKFNRTECKPQLLCAVFSCSNPGTNATYTSSLLNQMAFYLMHIFECGRIDYFYAPSFAVRGSVEGAATRRFIRDSRRRMGEEKRGKPRRCVQALCL